MPEPDYQASSFGWALVMILLGLAGAGTYYLMLRAP
jgi:hypothetical protein